MRFLPRHSLKARVKARHGRESLLPVRVRGHQPLVAVNGDLAQVWVEAVGVPLDGEELQSVVSKTYMYVWQLF